MTHDTRPPRFDVRSLLTRVLLAGVLASPAYGQDLPPSLLRSPDLPPAVYTSRALLRLPLVELDEKSRANIREIRLMVKPPSGLWMLHSSGPADQRTFDFRAGADGEYRFTFVMVSRDGVLHPPDPDKAPPHRVVVVDTVAPTLKVQTLQLPGGEIVAHARIDDANPKPESIRMACKMPGGNWQAMEPVSTDAPGAYRVPNPTLFNGGTLRVTAADAAGNAVTSEVRLDIPPESLTVGPAPTPATVAVRSPSAPALPTQIRVPESTSARIEMPAPVPMPTQTLETPAPISVAPPALALAPPAAVDPNEMATPEPIRIPKSVIQDRLNGGGMRPPVITETPGASAAQNVPSGYQLPPERVAERPVPLPEVITREPPAVSTTVPVKVETPTSVPVFATPRMLLDYRSDGSNRPLLFWLTRDRGQTWEKLRDDNPGQSPARLVLPGEGVFGIAARTRSGGEVEAKAPAAGDAVDSWVEVDSTKPTVELGGVRTAADDPTGLTTISWTATDRNLTATPIALSYSTRADGPWLPIASSLRNEGVHRWNRPAGGEAVWVRIEATDRAGNVGEHKRKLDGAPAPEAARPKVRVLGVGPG